MNSAKHNKKSLKEKFIQKQNLKNFILWMLVHIKFFQKNSYSKNEKDVINTIKLKNLKPT